jgi:hypothetical protein
LYENAGGVKSVEEDTDALVQLGKHSLDMVLLFTFITKAYKESPTLKSSEMWCGNEKLAMLPKDTPLGVLNKPLGNVNLTRSLGTSFTTNPVTTPQSLNMVMDRGVFIEPPMFPKLVPVGIFVNEVPKFSLDKELLFLLTTNRYHNPLSCTG